jgi:type IV pilus assembly protein PilQ
MKMIMGYRLCILFLFMAVGVAFAQTDPSAANSTTQTVAPSPTPASAEVATVPAETTAEEEAVAKPQTITLDFKEADIRDVLKIISYKSGVNIVSAPEVAGTVNVRISDVPWERALDVILKTYGYAYDKQDNIIMVAPLEKLTAQRKMEQDLAQVQPTRTDVFDLKYIDALDAKKAIEPQLSPRGKITILEVTGQAGWASLGSGSGTKAARGGEITSRSKTLIVSDVPPVLDKIKEVVEAIDVKIKQIMIETRIVEVNLNKLKDIGFDYGTGGPGSSVQTGAGFQAQNTTLTYDENGNVTGTVTTPAINQSPTVQSVTDTIKSGGSSLGNMVTPAAFISQAGGLTSLNTGLRLLFQKLEGTQFEVLFHALEENVASNTLSAPTILTLNNLEAYIIVGEKFPIVESNFFEGMEGYRYTTECGASDQRQK